jgi:aspartyl-tRNA(Asn)/glutamyl-tRNA(Gln) amidotransferase subunit C
MKISATDVEYVAGLANLEVRDDEKQEIAAQLSRIVEYVEQLEALDTDDVEPTSQIGVGASHSGRDDQVRKRMGSSEAARTVGLFKVPRVIVKR